MFGSKRLLWKLYPYYVLITLLSLLAVALFAAHFLKRFHILQIEKELFARANLTRSLLKEKIEEGKNEEVDEICKQVGGLTSSRITVILPSGLVIGDTIKDPSTMDNHADRPEIKEALLQKKGVSKRFSYTLKKNLLYIAVPYINDKEEIIAVVRASMPVTQILMGLNSIYAKILVVAVILVLFAALISFWLSNKVINEPLVEIQKGAEHFAKGELQYRLNIPDSLEMQALAETMNQMAEDLDDRIQIVTKQKKELEGILKSLTEAVIVVDTDERIVRFNEAAGHLFGIAPNDSQGRNIQEVIRNTQIQDFIKENLKTRKPNEKDITLLDPVERSLQARGTILKDPEGVVTGTLIALNDITHLKKLETIRRDFVSNVSHELKTPITSIKGFVETLKDGADEDPKTRKKFLDIIMSQSERLHAIIEDLLSISRIEQMEDKEKIELEAAKVRSILVSAIGMCELKAKTKDIKIELVCDENLKAKLNPPFMENAITNLLDNAIKYTDPKKNVRLEAYSSNHTVEIKVIDQGYGIPAEHISRIFERFYRVDKARSRKMGGTGLGLAIVKHIVQAHGGSINVESTPLEGSTFTISIPS